MELFSSISVQKLSRVDSYRHRKWTDYLKSWTGIPTSVMECSNELKGWESNVNHVQPQHCLSCKLQRPPVLHSTRIIFSACTVVAGLFVLHFTRTICLKCLLVLNSTRMTCTLRRLHILHITVHILHITELAWRTVEIRKQFGLLFMQDLTFSTPPLMLFMSYNYCDGERPLKTFGH